MLEEQDTQASETASAWKLRVDGLATRLMVEGGSPEIIAELRSMETDFGLGENSPGRRILREHIAMCEQDLDGGTALLLKCGLADLHASLATSSDEHTVDETPLSLGEDAELVADFLVESREHLSQIEGQMLVLERDPTALEVIHAVFRAFHTIKGLAGFLDFSSVQALAHEVETLLDLARNEKLTIDSAIVDVVLASGDGLEAYMAAIEHTLNNGGPLRMPDQEALLIKIRLLAVPRSTQTLVEGSVEKATEPLAVMDPAAVELLPLLQPLPAPVVAIAVPQSVAAAATLPPAVANPTPVSPPSPAGAPALAQPSRNAAAPRAAAIAEQPPSREPVRSADASSVRVETSKLDHLMNMVGEIVIAQSLIRHNQLLASATDSRLLGDLSQLARVTIEVQRATMRMRMVPVGQLFQRIERVIRDLSRKAGKQVILETSGTETELDKTVAEELSDPLLHMVRNSVDHGIEQVAERIAAGKPTEARIRLSAFHQGGQVVIQISDDGRGLNSEKIRRKAEDKGLIAPDTQLTEAEIYQLIFEPGFSTAEKITDVSGRGVGMDVVRRNVEKLRGRIEIQSSLGKGTTFTLKLPLTLAIIDGLVVEVGTERYIIPLSGVREIFRPQDDAFFTVEGRDEMLLVREKLIPVVRLHERLGIEGRAKMPSEGIVVVLDSEGRQFCLLVDDLLGKQEVVIKSLGETFKDVSGLSGCAVLGDGHVGLILDVDGIYRGRR